jgi:hypothetical protein
MPGQPSTITGTCALCRSESIPLCYSDLLPKAISRWIRKSGQSADRSNPNPVIVTSKVAIQTNFRVAEYLLCPDCEERLNKHGETWVLANAFRGGVEFPLRQALRDGTPAATLPSFKLFVADQLPSVDLDRIIHFALSVFWKASAANWSSLDHTSRLNLGPYAEHIRRFLLNEGPFPKKTALIVSVAGSDNPPLVSIFPYSGRSGSTRQHRFSIPGMTFWLHMGELPPSMSALCAATSRSICLVPDLDETFYREAKPMFDKAIPIGSLKVR